MEIEHATLEDGKQVVRALHLADGSKVTLSDEESEGLINTSTAAIWTGYLPAILAMQETILLELRDVKAALNVAAEAAPAPGTWKHGPVS